jgi:hypothetical protein
LKWRQTSDLLLRTKLGTDSEQFTELTMGWILQIHEGMLKYVLYTHHSYAK